MNRQAAGARLVAGEPGVVMMTELRGVSNAKAKRELGWHPAHPSWREGFTEPKTTPPEAGTAKGREDPDRP